MNDVGSVQNWLIVFLLLGITAALFFYLLIRKKVDFSEDAKFIMMDSYE